MRVVTDHSSGNPVLLDHLCPFMREFRHHRFEFGQQVRGNPTASARSTPQAPTVQPYEAAPSMLNIAYARHHTAQAAPYAADPAVLTGVFASDRAGAFRPPSQQPARPARSRILLDGGLDLNEAD
ncbi:hypothetical protein [Paracoccus xiamenensis]|uniref:hypothetical protein n=1 Tax=Paracoccus xiamenensis TaxID=2714901 RepID=UPI00140C13DD|nr:hypothetical protein [Paracoccus xiamenensis]NHF73245.1 hypothetical protein [Paracoccus xiamenensis]